MLKNVLKIALLLSFILVLLPWCTKAECPIPDPGGCTNWADISYSYKLPACQIPNCYVTLKYKMRECGNTVQIKDPVIDWPDDQSECSLCITNYLYDRGIVYAPNFGKLAITMIQALDQAVYDDFGTRLPAYYPCPGGVTYDIYYPGDCVSWCSGYNLELHIYESCPLACYNGCCIKTHKMCYNNYDIQDEVTTSSIPSPNCTSIPPEQCNTYHQLPWIGTPSTDCFILCDYVQLY